MASLLFRLARLALPLGRRLPAPVKNLLRGAWSRVVYRRLAQAPSDDADAYALRAAIEHGNFAHVSHVHDLPAIYHYWSNKYLRPQLEAFGYSHPDDFFARELERAYHESAAKPAYFASIGAGNCDTEIRVAQILRARGVHDFVIDCLDINASMLARGRAQALEAGVAANIHPLEGDFNRWQPPHAYDAVIANQSLHHVTALEHLFDAVAGALTKRGRFVVADMIGRNGHRRWPAALAIVEETWAALPARCRYDHQRERRDDAYPDTDHAAGSFEGIRAQDILPLLAERFAFEFFFAFGNVIDPFVDRGYGPNFDPANAADRALIDAIHARDEAAQRAGRIPPTHMMAVLFAPGRAAPLRCREPVTPQFALAARTPKDA